MGVVRCTARMTPPTEFPRTLGVGNRNTRTAAAVEHHSFDPYRGEITLDQGTLRGDSGRETRGQGMLITKVEHRRGKRQTHCTRNNANWPKEMRHEAAYVLLDRARVITTEAVISVGKIRHLGAAIRVRSDARLLS